MPSVSGQRRRNPNGKRISGDKRQCIEMAIAEGGIRRVLVDDVSNQ